MGYAGTGINFANVAGDTFTGDGSTTGFTLTHTPGTKHAIDVYLAGVWQHKSTFSISGTTLTFDVAPPDQVEIAVEYRGLPISIGTPADDSVGRAQIDVTSLGPVIQVVYTQDGDTEYDISSTTPAFDDTIPQISEGTEVTSLNTSITPKNASNILEIEVLVSGSPSAAQHSTMSLYEGATADALTVSHIYGNGAGFNAQHYLKFYKTAGSVAARTYTVRIGVSAGTYYVNQSNNASRFGGKYCTFMKITEYLVAN